MSDYVSWRKRIHLMECISSIVENRKRDPTSERILQSLDASLICVEGHTAWDVCCNSQDVWYLRRVLRGAMKHFEHSPFIKEQYLKCVQQCVHFDRATHLQILLEEIDEQFSKKVLGATDEDFDDTLMLPSCKVSSIAVHHVIRKKHVQRTEPCLEIEFHQRCMQKASEGDNLKLFKHLYFLVKQPHNISLRKCFDVAVSKGSVSVVDHLVDGHWEVCLHKNMDAFLEASLLPCPFVFDKLCSVLNFGTHTHLQVGFPNNTVGLSKVQLVRFWKLWRYCRHKKGELSPLLVYINDLDVLYEAYQPSQTQMDAPEDEFFATLAEHSPMKPLVIIPPTHKSIYSGKFISYFVARMMHVGLTNETTAKTILERHNITEKIFRENISTFAFNSTSMCSIQ